VAQILGYEIKCKILLCEVKFFLSDLLGILVSGALSATDYDVLSILSSAWLYLPVWSHSSLLKFQ